MSNLTVGAKAPDFTLFDKDGKSVSLEHNGYAYSFSVEGSTVSLTENGFITEPSNLVKLVLA